METKNLTLRATFNQISIKDRKTGKEFTYSQFMNCLYNCGLIDDNTEATSKALNHGYFIVEEIDFDLNDFFDMNPMIDTNTGNDINRDDLSDKFFEEGFINEQNKLTEKGIECGMFQEVMDRIIVKDINKLMELIQQVGNEGPEPK